MILMQFIGNWRVSFILINSKLLIPYGYQFEYPHFLAVALRMKDAHAFGIAWIDIATYAHSEKKSKSWSNISYGVIIMDNKLVTCVKFVFEKPLLTDSNNVKHQFRILPLILE